MTDEGNSGRRPDERGSEQSDDRAYPGYPGQWPHPGRPASQHPSGYGGNASQPPVGGYGTGTQGGGSAYGSQGGPGYGTQGGGPGYGPYGAPGQGAYPGERQQPRTEHKSRLWPFLIAAVLLGVLAGFGGGVAGAWVMDQDEDTGTPAIGEPLAQQQDPPDPEEVGHVAAIAAEAGPSVVYIQVPGGDGGGALGSGFIISEDGYVVTNNHVVASAAGGADIIVQFADKRQVQAEVVGADVDSDLAVLKVDETGLPTLEFGNSEQLVVGAPVMAVGAPLGLDQTVTSGIVSALNRPVTIGRADQASYINAIQTDAPINPGNSGGPLLDMNGDVIGVNSAIYQIPTAQEGISGSIGLGFAIPSVQAQRTVQQLIETGEAVHPVIGVVIDLTYARQGAKVIEEGQGVQQPVVPGGPADEAGIRPGDVIVEMDGTRIGNGNEFIVYVRSKAVGEDVELLVRSPDGDERTLTLTLQAAEN